jgi:4-amino-4-deoxy-L-arabinose transferase-like glycosyltransferase
VAGISAAVLVLRGIFIGRYDVFRDELYFIVCGWHPAFGYADQPPLVPIMAAGLHALGLGAFGLRLPALVAAAGLIALAARFVLDIGGRKLAMGLAMIATATAPMLMGMTAMLTTSAFDPIAWTLIAWLIVRARSEQRDDLLIGAGAIAGIALEIKYSVAFWLIGLVVGLALTGGLRLLRTRGFAIGLGLAFLIALPSAIWQALHGFPFLDLAAAAGGKNAEVALGPFVANQFMVMNPLYAPLWLAGLIHPFLSRRHRDLRFIPIACLVVFLIVRLGHGKDYYLAPCYPVLLVIGAVAWESVATKAAARIAVLAVALAGLCISAIALPMSVPILSPPALIGWMARIGVVPQQQEKSFAGTALPQHYADQLGWHDFTAQTEKAWQAIPAGQRATTAILTDNYGEAAALDVLAHGLPPALSGHNQYWYWGLRGQSPRNLLVVLRDPEELRDFCANVHILGHTQSPFAMAHENGKALAWCQGLRRPLQSIWPDLRNMS